MIPYHESFPRVSLKIAGLSADQIRSGRYCQGGGHEARRREMLPRKVMPVSHDMRRSVTAEAVIHRSGDCYEY